MCNEERVVTTPTLAGGKQSEGWFLDTGAMNHMTSLVDAFAELDRSITGKVRFADGSVVEIHGHGTVVCGPITPATPGGRRYILLLVDDYNRFMWVLLLASKDEAERAIVKQQAAAEVDCGHKLRVLRMDHGGEFTSATFYKHYDEKGVKRHLKAPYSPQKNGVIE